MATYREEDHLLDQTRSENDAVRKNIEEINKVAGILFAANAALLVFLSGNLLSQWQKEAAYAGPTLANVTTEYFSSIDPFQIRIADTVEFTAILFFAFSAFICIELFVVSIRNPSPKPMQDVLCDGVQRTGATSITGAILAREQETLEGNKGIYQEILRTLFRSLSLLHRARLGPRPISRDRLRSVLYSAVPDWSDTMVYVSRTLWRRPERSTNQKRSWIHLPEKWWIFRMRRSPGNGPDRIGGTSAGGVPLATRSPTVEEDDPETPMSLQTPAADR